MMDNRGAKNSRGTIGRDAGIKKQRKKRERRERAKTEPKQIWGLEKPCEDERVESPVRGSRYLVVIDTRVFECGTPQSSFFDPRRDPFATNGP